MIQTCWREHPLTARCMQALLHGVRRPIGQRSWTSPRQTGNGAHKIGVTNLAGHLADGAGGVVEEDGGVALGGAHLLEHVKVLRHHLRAQQYIYLDVLVLMKEKHHADHRNSAGALMALE